MSRKLEGLNGLLERRNRRIQVITGEVVTPGMGRPQEVINRAANLTECDVYVGLVWLRFGTPTGGKTKKGDLLLSGTQEEFQLAYDSWLQTGRPEILFYFCDRAPENLSSFDPEQYARVREFRSNFNKDGLHPGLIRTYKIPADLPDLVVTDVFRCVDEKDAEGINQRDFTESIARCGFERLFLPHTGSEREARKRIAIDASAGPVRLVAHSGFSFLGGIGARYGREVRGLLTRGGAFRVTLTAPWSETALLLALSETPSGSEEKVVAIAKDRAFLLVEKSQWYSIKFRDAMLGCAELIREFPGQIDLRLTVRSMPATVFISDEQAFFEPLLMSDIGARRRAMMSGFELMVSRTCDFFAVLAAYEQFTYRDAIPVGECWPGWQDAPETWLGPITIPNLTAQHTPIA